MGASDGGYAPREPQSQPQPQQAYPPREPQPYMPREQRFNNNRNQQPYGGRPQHQPQPQQSQQQPVPSNGGDAGDIDQLPAFVTGGAPQQPSQAAPNGGHPQNGFESGAPDRFPLHRRRRRRHGPRPDGGPGDVPPSGPVGE
jgi:hypothetical protein